MGPTLLTETQKYLLSFRTGKVFLDNANVSAEQVEIEANYFGLERMLETLVKKQPIKTVAKPRALSPPVAEDMIKFIDGFNT
jgi:hypothetical protein